LVVYIQNRKKALSLTELHGKHVLHDDYVLTNTFKGKTKPFAKMAHLRTPRIWLNENWYRILNVYVQIWRQLYAS